MDWIYPVILVGAVLVGVSVLTSLLAFRISAPLLLLFLGIGFLAGEDGLGLQFDDPNVVYLVGSLALAVILFDSGFGTPVATLRRAAAPAFVLATVGVLLTTALVAVGARFLFDLPWLYALLMGAIVSSTDAAAVFFLLRAGGVKIYKRARSVLEVESGSNDPMAIFLSLLFIELILADASWSAIGPAFVHHFALQMGLGLAFGALGGVLVVELLRRVRLEEALYPIAVMATALAVFALTGMLGGSGFLAVYVAGIIAGNKNLRGVGNLRRYQTGMTWLAQIVMFVMLGLMATPSEFLPVLLPAVVLALFLTFIARPVAVLSCVLPFRLGTPTVTFVSWVGLRGAVSILLAVLPLIAGIPDGELFFNVAFVMVLTSLILQGWTIPPMARWLNLSVPQSVGPVERVELDLPGAPRHELVVYHVIADSPVTHGEAIPRWARPSLIIRGQEKLQFEAVGTLQPGDYAYIMCAPEHVRLLDRLFAGSVNSWKGDTEFFGRLRLNPGSTAGELAEAYNFPIDADVADVRLGTFIERQLRGQPLIGDRVRLGPAELIVRELDGQRQISAIGLDFVEPQKPRGPGFLHRVLSRLR